MLDTMIWRTVSLLRTLVVTVVLGIFGSHIGIAQTCSTDHAIKEGETLAQIAARVYGNSTQWTVVFYANQDRFGANASLLVPGLLLSLPRIGGVPPPRSAPPVAN